MNDAVDPWLFFAPAVGLWAAAMAYRASKRARKSKSWPTTNGTVMDSELLRGRGGESAFIRYRYFTPEERVGYGLGSGGRLIANPSALVRRYPKGSKVIVRYDPTNPADSFLESDSQVQFRGLIFLAVIGIAFPPLYFLWISWLK